MAKEGTIDARLLRAVQAEGIRRILQTVKPCDVPALVFRAGLLAIAVRVNHFDMLATLERSNWLLFDRCVGTRPLSNGSAITPPPRPSLVLRPSGW
jgi:hypothetical protein